MARIGFHCSHEQYAPSRLLDLVRKAEAVGFEAVREKVRVSAEPERHLEWLLGDLELGFEEVYIHNLNRDDQEHFLDTFGEKVLPALQRR
ncbi:hypothetical protein BH23GEM6_BH23GEM6_23550 [soil metagenome]